MSSIREEEYNKPLNLRIWAKMLPFFKPYRKEIFAIIALMLLSALIDVCFPLMQSLSLIHIYIKAHGFDLAKGFLNVLRGFGELPDGIKLCAKFHRVCTSLYPALCRWRTNLFLV